MLIKYTGQNRFIFVANSKSASSSIEASRLSDLADVRITSAYAGKHMTIERVYERFSFLFKNFPYDSFFKFAVMRDPLEWVVSWYNFRSRPSLKKGNASSQSNYVGDLSFAEFWEQHKGEDFLSPQTTRLFSSEHPHVKVDYIIRQEAFFEDFKVVRDLLNLGSVRIPKKNRSLSRITSADVDAATKADIYDFYQADYKILENLADFNTQGVERYRAATQSDSTTRNVQKRSLQDVISLVQYRLGVMLQRG